MSKNKNKYEPRRWETQDARSYTRLYDDMLKSQAWKDLKHSSRSVYTLLKMQYKGNYTGDIIECPYSYFQDYGMSTTTIKNAIRDLEEHGFIRCKVGTLVTKNLHRQPNSYEFIDAWKKWKSDGRKKRELPDKLKERNQKRKK